MILYALTLCVVVGALIVFIYVYIHHYRLLKNKRVREGLKGHLRQHLYITNFAFINATATFYIAYRDIFILHAKDGNVNLYGIIALSSTVIFGGLHYIRELKDEY